MNRTTDWNQLPVMLNTREVALVLGYGSDVVRGLCKVGKMPHIRLGRAFMIPRDALRSWVETVATQATLM